MRMPFQEGSKMNDFISIKGVKPPLEKPVDIPPITKGKMPFPLNDDDFKRIIQRLGDLPFPADRADMLINISDRALHAALVAIIAAYVREDGSVYFDASVTAAILTEAFKFIAENGEADAD